MRANTFESLFDNENEIDRFDFVFVGLDILEDLNHWIVLSGFDFITQPSKTIWPKFCVTAFRMAFVDGES
jgi:hypothetical protein